MLEKKQEKIVDIGKFFRGKNNVAKETSLPEGSLRDAINVDIDDAGNTRAREGYELLYAGNVRSVYYRYFAEGDELKYLNYDNTATIITEVNSNNRIDYCKVNNLVYFTDGIKSGVINGTNYSPLGIETPLSAPDLTYTPAGSLRPGIYQITTSFINIITGEVSGAPLVSTITLDSIGGIRLSVLPSQEGYSTVVYASNGNNVILYEQITLPNNIASYVLTSIKTDTKECDSQFLSPMPGGQIIEYYRGLMYIAKDKELWFSGPRQFGLTQKASNFFAFPERITVCVAVDSGLFIVADKTYFLSFNKAEEARMTETSQNKAVEGTTLILSGSDLNLPDLSQMKVAYWFSEVGAVIGLPNGTTSNLTESMLAVSDNTDKIGASLFKQYNGIKQIISTMPVGNEVSTLQSNDSATLTVIRNGVVVP